MNAWDAINSGRIYRNASLLPNQYMKLTGVGPTGWKVLWDTYESYTYGYSINKLPMPDGEGVWNITAGTNAIYYRSVTVDSITGALTFTDPSGDISSEEALLSDPPYLYRHHLTDSDKYYKLISLWDIYMSYEVYSSSQDWDMQEQFKNNEGALCYWLNDSYKIMTTTVTSYPVYIYKYAELVKMEHAFVEKMVGPTPQLIPTVTLGAGIGDGEKGKGRLFKNTDGLYFEYYSTITENPIGLYMKDTGITYDNNGVIVSLPTCNIVTLTVADYTALNPKDDNTIYFTY